MLKQYLQWPFAAVLVTAAFFLVNALWIPAKAGLAQLLLEDAWQRNLAGEKNAKPWPWADTSPVGVLEVPALGVRLIVLEGNSGRNLAFGPTMQSATEVKDKILSGHRDTHFQFLESIKKGEIFRFTSLAGTIEYQVLWLEIIDSWAQEILLQPELDRLTLVTCFPFHTASTGGPLRYVVSALPVE
jgi:sortase A